ncbi:MAG: hypothetical protein JXQ29_06360 [Planctomycetes bacterium]|nr:hypothetical protein [Planctomycetota bacterium]
MTAMRLILLGVAALLGAAGGGPGAPDEVDFGRPPVEGLWFSRVRQIDTEPGGEVRADGLGTQRQRQKMVYTEDYSEKIDKVEGRKVTALKRQYVAATTLSEIETDRMLNPAKDQHEELYSGHDFLVQWGADGTMSLSVLHTEDPSRPPIGENLTLREASEAVRSALEHAFDYPGPFLPADDRPRRVGDSWTLSEEALNRILPRRPDQPLRGTMAITFTAVDPEFAVKVSTVEESPEGFLLARAPVDRKVACAVLNARASLRNEPQEGEALPLRLELSGTLHYSLEHRLILQFDLAGTLRIEGTLRDYTFRHGGTYRDRMLLQLHEAARVEAPVDPQAPEDD